MQKKISNVKKHPCSAPTRGTQVELKIKNRNQGFENLIELYLIWSNINICIQSTEIKKNYEKKSYNSVRLRTQGQSDNTYSLYLSVFSSQLITVQTSLLQTIVVLISPSARYNIFSRPFYVTFTQWRHIFSRNYVNILREMPIATYSTHKYNVS